ARGRYEPGIHRTYAELAAHYGTTILPARPAKPRDKAIAEVGVQVAGRWIVARLRHETFYTLTALNERIGELLEALVDWVTTIGPQAAALVTAILADRPHPEQSYRSCLGILRLAKRYDAARLEAACARALAAGARSYRHVDAILKRGLDRVAGVGVPAATPLP